VTRNPSASRWLLLAAYPVVGLALGLADPALGQLAQQLGTKPGAATAVSVNLLLPLAAVILSLAVVRLWSAWFGACTLTLGFLAGLALRYPTRIPDGSLAEFLRSVPPILVAAALGYAGLGTLAVLTRRARCTPHECDGPPVG
jgi:hypothetical protein